MEKILLTSVNFIKNVTNISDNISPKLLEPAIWHAQNEELRSVLGDGLVDRLEELVSTGDIDLTENEMYRNLLNKAQYFLAYSAIADVCILTSVKIDNGGLEQVSDEHMDPITISESFQIQRFYQIKSDFMCRQLQNYVLKNRTAFPELSECDCRSIRSNLFSSATTGLWLGGVRGRIRH